MANSKKWVFTDFELLDWNQIHGGTDRIQYIAWSKEMCPKTMKIHFQGFLQLCRRTKMVPLKKIIGTKKIYLAPMRGTTQQNYKYINKETPMETVGEYIESRQGQGRLEPVISAIREGATMDDLWEDHTNIMIRYHKGIQECVHKLQPRIEIGKYKLTDFQWPEILFDEKSIIIWGETGIGKTQFALSHFMRPLFISHIDGLRQFTRMHDGIIFDDMSFKHIPREGQIHLVDTEHDREIHCRYNNAFIPAGIKKVFTTNVYDGEIFDLEDDAIARRITIVHVKGKHKKDTK